MPLVKGSDHNDPEYSQELYLHNGTGIRYRGLFLVKSHLWRTRSILRTLNDPFWGPFGCIFCCAEGARSFAQVFESADSLMEHLGSHHLHRFLKHSPLLDQTRSVIGRAALIEEEFDLNIPQRYMSDEVKLDLQKSSGDLSSKATALEVIPEKTPEIRMDLPYEKQGLPKASRKSVYQRSRPRGHLRDETGSDSPRHTRSSTGAMWDRRVQATLSNSSGPQKPSQHNNVTQSRWWELRNSQNWGTNSPAISPIDLSDCGSVPTTVTTPEDYSDNSVDAGSTQHGRFDHILRASEYYEELDSLEAEIAECCGLSSEPKVQTGPLSTYLPVLGQYMTALEKLREAGFCGRLFSILIEVSSRPNIAKTVHSLQMK